MESSESRKKSNREAERKYYEANREKILEKNRRYRAANREKLLEQKREVREANLAQFRERDRRYRAANPEVMRERYRRWKAANPAKVVENNRRYRAANPEKIRARKRRTVYSIDEMRYTDLWQVQQGRCAGCGVDLTGLSKSPHIDHDHRCCPGKKSCGGCVRGLLCERCNLTLGKVVDDPVVLRRLADYIEAHPLKPRDQMQLFGEENKGDDV